jgi:electron-transferring-flavoprotein dehydrogenase
MERYLEGVRGRNGAVGVGVEAVKNMATTEDGGKDLVEEAVQKEIKRRQNHVRINVNEYAGLLGRGCPAGVYEYVVDESKSGEGEGEGWGGQKLVINSQVRLGSYLCSFFTNVMSRTVFTANFVISKYQLKI